MFSLVDIILDTIQSVPKRHRVSPENSSLFFIKSLIVGLPRALSGGCVLTLTLPSCRLIQVIVTGDLISSFTRRAVGVVSTCKTPGASAGLGTGFSSLVRPGGKLAGGGCPSESILPWFENGSRHGGSFACQSRGITVGARLDGMNVARTLRWGVGPDSGAHLVSCRTGNNLRLATDGSPCPR